MDKKLSKKYTIKWDDLTLKFPKFQPKFSSNTKIDNQIKDNLSKAWKNVTDCHYSQAITNYNECLVLFNVLSSPHEHMVCSWGGRARGGGGVVRTSRWYVAGGGGE